MRSRPYGLAGALCREWSRIGLSRMDAGSSRCVAWPSPIGRGLPTVVGLGPWSSYPRRVPALRGEWVFGRPSPLSTVAGGDASGAVCSGGRTTLLPRRPVQCGTLLDMADETKRLSFEVDPSKKKRMRRLAADNDRTLAAECRRAIDAHLEAQALAQTPPPPPGGRA